MDLPDCPPATEDRKYEVSKISSNTNTISSLSTRKEIQNELYNAPNLLVYYKKNPEQHPKYAEEWEKFWTRRYKEVKAEKKDTRTHDFKDEWIVFWSKRMVELHKMEAKHMKKMLEKQWDFHLDKSLTHNLSSNNERSPLRKHTARSRSPRRRPSRSPVRNRRSPHSSPYNGDISRGYVRKHSPVSRSQPRSRSRNTKESHHSNSHKDVKHTRDERRSSKTKYGNASSRRREELRNTRSRIWLRSISSEFKDDLAWPDRSPSPMFLSADYSKLITAQPETKKGPSPPIMATASRNNWPYNCDIGKQVNKQKELWEQESDDLDNEPMVLAEHLKNPEKHPQYTEEWQKFWTRRFKEIMAKNKDPTKHDFKSEWMVFWSERMIELHNEKIKIKKKRLQQEFCLNNSPSRDLATNLTTKRETLKRREKVRSPSLLKRQLLMAGDLSPHRSTPTRGSQEKIKPDETEEDHITKSLENITHTRKEEFTQPVHGKEELSCIILSNSEFEHITAQPETKQGPSPPIMATASRNNWPYNCDIGKQVNKQKELWEQESDDLDNEPMVLAEHLKNPEKHPQYTEEWQKFWTRRFKEVMAAENKDPTKHDFKSEWMVFWSERMIELHNEKIKNKKKRLQQEFCLDNSPSRHLATNLTTNRESLKRDENLRSLSLLKRQLPIALSPHRSTPTTGSQQKFKPDGTGEIDITKSPENIPHTRKVEYTQPGSQEKFKPDGTGEVDITKSPENIPHKKTSCDLTDIIGPSGGGITAQPETKQGPSPPIMATASRNNWPYNCDIGKQVNKQKELWEQESDDLDNEPMVLAEHLKNPEKHPQYTEEWQKFWTRRFKEVMAAENKDPTKHDFKSEWMVFWSERMIELHNEKIKNKKKRLQQEFCLDNSPSRHLATNLTTNRESLKRDENLRSLSLLKRQLPIALSPHRSTPTTGSQQKFKPDGTGEIDITKSPENIPHTRKVEYTQPGSQEKFKPDGTGEVDITKSPENIPHKRKVEYTQPGSQEKFKPDGAVEVDITKSPENIPHTRKVEYTQPVHEKEDLSCIILSDSEHGEASANPPLHASSSILKIKKSVKCPLSQSNPQQSMRSGRHEASRVPKESPIRTRQQEVLPVLRLLVAVEDYLGPHLGPKVLDLLGEALKMEKEKPNSAENILDIDEYTVLLEMAKEKLRGKVEVGLLELAIAAPVREIISRTTTLLQLGEQRKRKRQTEAVKEEGILCKATIKQQLAATLLTQGKTNVSEEEMASLLETVHGMFKASRRTGDMQPIIVENLLKQIKSKAVEETEWSALDLLRDAYVEQKETETEVDVGCGMSDSELKTLMQNFTQLFSDEQEKLVAYIKKLEVQNPSRVKSLCQFSNFGSDETPVPAKMAALLTKTAPETMTSADKSQQLNNAVMSSDNKTQQEIMELEDVKQNEMEVVQKCTQDFQPDINNESQNLLLSNNGLFKLLLNIARKGSANTSSSPPPADTCPNTDTQKDGVKDAKLLAPRQLQNSVDSAITVRTGSAQNLQTAPRELHPAESRVCGDIQDSQSAIDSILLRRHQISNRYADSGRQHNDWSYRDRDTQYVHHGQYSHTENSTWRDYYSQSGNSSQHCSQTRQISQEKHGSQNVSLSQYDLFLPKAKFSKKKMYLQNGCLLQKDKSLPNSDSSTKDDSLQMGNSSKNKIKTKRGNFWQLFSKTAF